jgi:hypothetical protein
VRHAPDANPPMTKLFAFVGATILSYVGWWCGARVGIMTAFVLSMVGTGVGIYYGRKLAQHWGA